MSGFEALQGILGVLLLVLLHQGPWQWFCTDYTRQKLFMERNRLFDLAMEGEISFSDPAYVTIRSHLETLIRFAHSATWLRFAFAGWTIVRLSGVPRDRCLEAIDKITDLSVRSEFREIYGECGRLVVVMLAMKSVVGFPLLLCFRHLSRRQKSIRMDRHTRLWKGAIATAHALPSYESTMDLAA